MNGLVLSLLGPFAATLGGRSIHKFRTNRVQALLAFMATEGALGSGRHRREALMELLWPGLPRKSGQMNLRQTIYTMRKTVPEIPATESGRSIPFLNSDRLTLEINLDYPLELDVAQFMHLLKGAPEGWGAAVELYRGDFLKDFYLPDSSAFEEWAGQRRAAFRGQALKALADLAESSTALADYQSAKSFARRQLEINPLRESACRQLMTALARCGRRSEALIVYEEHQAVLWNELGVEPSAETVALREAIASGQIDQAAPSQPEAALDRAEIVTSTAESEPLPATLPRPLLSNLPMQATPFIGREVELAALEAFFTDADTRLVTIVGSGGIGKTRLALAAAERQAPLSHEEGLKSSPVTLVKARPDLAMDDGLFPNGVFFVSLGPLNSAEHIVPAIAEALGFQLESGERQTRPPKQQLLDYLRSKQMLMVMDNYEHLQDGVDLLADILNAAPGVQILATSRERLYSQHEQLFPITGLEFPEDEPGKVRELDKIESLYPAVRLFLAAARRLQPDYQLAAGEIEQLSHICRLVDGMPLGLEMAASWVNALSLTHIAEEIQQSLDFLATEARAVESRHRSMRAVFESSWRQLDAGQRQIFSQLSVFRGGFTRRAAQSVTGASVRQLLALVSKSLLQFEKARDRYQVHELLRQFGAGKLGADPSEETEVREKHCAYFCQWLQPLETDLKGRRQRWAIDQIGVDLDNVRVAWDWAVDKSMIDELARAVDSLGHFYQRRGDFTDGDRAFEAAASSLRQQHSIDGAAGDSVLRIKTLAKMLVWQGDFQTNLGRGEKAQRLFQESLDLLNAPELEAVDIRPERAFALCQIGILTRHSDIVKAKELLLRSLSLCRETGEQWLEGKCLRPLGIIAQSVGDYKAAKRLAEESLAIWQALGNREGLAQAYWEQAFIAFFTGEFETGESLLQQYNAILSDSDNRASTASGLLGLGFGYSWIGKFTRTKDCWMQCADIYEELGAKLELARVTTLLGNSLVHLGEYKAAQTLALKGLTLHQQIGWAAKARTSMATLTVSLVALSVGEYAEAARMAKQSKLAYEAVGYSQRLAQSLALWAHAAYGLGEPAKARGLALEALRSSIEIRNAYALFYTLPLVALLLASEGQLGRAVHIQALAWHIPYVANSRWLFDAAGRRLESLASSMPPDELAAARAEGESLDLWETAAELVEELPRLGWG